MNVPGILLHDIRSEERFQFSRLRLFVLDFSNMLILMLYIVNPGFLQFLDPHPFVKGNGKERQCSVCYFSAVGKTSQIHLPVFWDITYTTSC